MPLVSVSTVPCAYHKHCLQKSLLSNNGPGWSVLPLIFFLWNTLIVSELVWDSLLPVACRRNDPAQVLDLTLTRLSVSTFALCWHLCHQEKVSLSAGRTMWKNHVQNYVGRPRGEEATTHEVEKAGPDVPVSQRPHVPTALSLQPSPTKSSSMWVCHLWWSRPTRPQRTAVCPASIRRSRDTTS